MEPTTTYNTVQLLTFALTISAFMVRNLSKLYKTEMKIENALKENNELISIFVKSIETAQNNLNA